jgi:hypothetical protein
MAPSLTFEHAHALDAPQADYDTWLDDLEFGICTSCGRDAWSGMSGWWHADGNRLCPDRHMRTPGFSPDVPND